MHLNNVWETSLRTLIAFCYLLLIMRVLGKKQLGQITFFSYITGIALGNIAGEMTVEEDVTVVDGIVSMTLWALLTLAVEWISMKSVKARVLLDGEPSIVVKHGRIVEKSLRKAKLNLDDLTMLLREKDIFSLAEIDYAILEPNGKLSVLLQPEQEPPKRKDLHLKTAKRRYLPSELVADGNVVARNLRELGLTRGWLDEQLRRSGARSARDVLFAELQEDGSVHVDLKRPSP